ncbi:replication initiation protein [Spirosoma agri]|uniref:Replication initiation protein n=1 Tax=Spirosoma agri TaxID=1987381 RepID=A0A6M0IRP6_9BACT|nr:replication initiation protein [Spirosoma agri]NEU70926.1 replication initiation protein [Spirosoma agri]
MRSLTPVNQLSLLSYINTSEILFQGNALTSAHYEMTALQKNIFYMVQSQLGADDPTGMEYVVRVKDIMGLTNIKNPYDDLKIATETMMQKILTIKVPDGYLQVAPFSSVQYNTKQGTIAISIDAKLRPFLFNLDSRFTTYGLQDALNVSGKYTKRLYEMLSQWKHLGLMKITVQELKSRLKLYDIHTEIEQYPNWDGFRRRILLPAIGEINTKTDLSVTLYTERVNRKVAILKWTIKVIKTHALPPTLSDLHVRLVAEFNLRPDQAEYIIENFDAVFIYRKLHEIQVKNSSRRVNNMGAYTARVFGVK